MPDLLDIAQMRTDLQRPELMKRARSAEIDPEVFSEYLRHAELQQHAGHTVAPDMVRAPVLAPLPVISKARVPTSPIWHRSLDVEQFGQAMHAELSALPISGYTLRVRRRGETVYTLFWNWARRPQDTPEKGWKPDIKMHVASVSKLITAMAIVKILGELRISYDAQISPYLPAYFKSGANVQGLTFRHFLTHSTGMKRVKDGGLNDGYTLNDFKTYYAKGVNAADVGRRFYNNGNFIALRIAMTCLLGQLSRDYGNEAEFFSIPWLTSNLAEMAADAHWDAVSIAAYQNYVTHNIFVPSFTQAKIEPEAQSSLAYSSDLTTKGSAPSAYLSAGTAGWWLSVDEVMNIMNTYWQSNAIVRQSVARKALRAGFGIDGMLTDSRGMPDTFTKGGDWTDGNGRTQQCVVAFAPSDIEVAVFVNSPIKDNHVADITFRQLKNHIR